MAFLGRHQLGNHLPLSLQCRNDSDEPTNPTEAPTYNVWLDNTLVTSDRKLPAADPNDLVGLFQGSIFLGHPNSGFQTGLYTVRYSYTISSTNYVWEDTFEIMPGGDQDGAVIALFHYERPQAQFLVYACDSGKVLSGRNPST